MRVRRKQSWVLCECERFVSYPAWDRPITTDLDLRLWHGSGLVYILHFSWTSLWAEGTTGLIHLEARYLLINYFQASIIVTCRRDMASQKPVEWVSSLIMRFEEQVSNTMFTLVHTTICFRFQIHITTGFHWFHLFYLFTQLINHVFIFKQECRFWLITYLFSLIRELYVIVLMYLCSVLLRIIYLPFDIRVILAERPVLRTESSHQLYPSSNLHSRDFVHFFSQSLVPWLRLHQSRSQHILPMTMTFLQSPFMSLFAISNPVTLSVPFPSSITNDFSFTNLLSCFFSQSPDLAFHILCLIQVRLG